MLQVLPREAQKKIHEAALEVLETVGVTIDSERIRGLLLDHGAREKAKNVILMSREFVYACRKKTPSKVIKDDNGLEDNSFFSFGYTCVNPLHWNSTALESFEKTSGHGIPIMINAEPLVGGTSPVTLAGSLVVADAEALSGIVIAQLLEPGRPCIYNLGFANVFDMQTMAALTGTAQNGLLGAAGAAMAQFHNLPSASWMCTDSSVVDSQSSYEKMLTGLMHALNHVNIVWGMGQLESELSMSLEQVVIDNDITGSILRAQKGILLDENQLALDVIREVGLSGDFIAHPHTLENFKDEIVNLRTANRKKREAWEAEGGKATEEKAAEVVADILRQEEISCLSDGQLKELMRIEKKWLEQVA